MGGVPYLYTFDEYLDMRREYDELQVMISKLSHMDYIDKKYDCEQASKRLFGRLMVLRGSLDCNDQGGWLGADAEAYQQTAREIRSQLMAALDDYIAAIDRVRTAAEARQEDVLRMIRECESGSNMALDDYAHVQLMLAAQGVVDML